MDKKAKLRELASQGQFERVEQEFGAKYLPAVFKFIGKKSSDWVPAPTPDSDVDSLSDDEGRGGEPAAAHSAASRGAVTTLKTNPATGSKRVSASQRRVNLANMVIDPDSIPEELKQKAKAAAARKRQAQERQEQPASKRARPAKPTAPSHPAGGSVYLPPPPSNIVPRAVEPTITAPYSLAPGDSVVILVQAAELFYEEHGPALRNAGVEVGAVLKALVAAAGADGCVRGKVQQLSGLEGMGAVPVDMQHVMFEMERGQPADGGAVLELHWLPITSRAAASPAHVVQRGHYDASVNMPVPLDANFRMQFATAEDPHLSEWYEGRVYHGQAVDATKYPDSKFRSLRVIWYEQDADTRKWDGTLVPSALRARLALQSFAVWALLGLTLHATVVSFFQTDSLVSPWEMHPSPAVRDGFTPTQEAAEAKLGPSSSLQAILNHLLALECAAAFLRPVAKKECPRYYQVIKEPKFLGQIRRALAAGEYASTGQLLDDVALVAANAKQFNQPERFEYRLGDELECAVKRVRERVRGASA